MLRYFFTSLSHVYQFQRYVFCWRCTSGVNTNVSLQFLLTQQIFWYVNFVFQTIDSLHKLGPFAVLTLVFLRFLPFIRYSHTNIMKVAYTNSNCSLHQETLHFWTIFNASFFEFLLFSIIYWWTFIAFNLENHQKWRSDLTGRAILCFIVVLTALIFLRTGWKLSWIYDLLFKIMQKVILHKRKH